MQGRKLAQYKLLVETFNYIHVMTLLVAQIQNGNRDYAYSFALVTHNPSHTSKPTSNTDTSLLIRGNVIVFGLLFVWRRFRWCD